MQRHKAFWETGVRLVVNGVSLAISHEYLRNSRHCFCADTARNGYTKAVDGEEGGGGGEGEEEEEGGEGDGGEENDAAWDEELDGENEGGVGMTRTDTLHSTTSSTGTQRRKGQHAKKQV
ncbi:hypothetical protein LDENG_00172220 [Lucifuga dentata]|nr:hypothetical protein LDENG_00172220 [Lucifuga dentata]